MLVSVLYHKLELKFNRSYSFVNKINYRKAVKMHASLLGIEQITIKVKRSSHFDNKTLNATMVKCTSLFGISKIAIKVT